MKNYFYGINKTANIRSNYYSENRNILSSDNSKLARYSSVAAIPKQSIVDTKILNFGNVDPRLSGAARTQALEDRMRQITEVTKNNPNFKMTPEAYKAIFEGQAFQAKIELNAPDRRNLGITGALTLLQLGAALVTGGNSGFNDKQAEIMTGRAKGDADFVTKYGNNYSKGTGFLGKLGVGSQFQDGQITITTGLRNEQVEAQTSAKKVDANIVAKANPNNVNSEVDTVKEASKETDLSVQEHEKNYVSGTGSIEDDAYKRLGAKYLRQLDKDDLKGSGISETQIQSLASAIENGITLKRSQIDQLRKIGFSIGQENGGGQGVVTSIVATQDNLNAGGVKGKLAKAATQDYLQLALTAGLFKENDIKPDKDGKQRKISDLSGQELFNLFEKVEKGLSNGTDINGKETGISRTNLKVDHLIGGQHITNLQYAVNERIRQNTDAAKQINDVINGKSGATISATTAAFYDKANPGSLKGNTAEEKAQDLQKKLANGDLTGVSATLNDIEDNINNVRNSVLSVAGGLYAEKNAVLEESLRKTDGADNTNTSGKSERDFFTGVKDLRSLVAFRQSGGTGSVSVEGGTSIKDQSISAQANGLVNDFKSGKVTSASQDSVISSLSENFRSQLNANGIESSIENVNDTIKAMAQGTALNSEMQKIYDSITTNKNTTINDNFLSLVNLEKSKTTPSSTAQESINSTANTIASNSGAVRSAYNETTFNNKAKDVTKPDESAPKYADLEAYKGPTLESLQAARLERENAGDYGSNLPEAKNKLQKFMRGLSDILDQKLVQADGADPKSFSDAFVSKMLEIADELLRKSVAQYSYGFADSASISTSNYNRGSDTPLSDMYNMTKAVGVGIQQGIQQADKYTGRRDDEKQAEGEKLGLREAMDKYKDIVKKTDEESAKITSQLAEDNKKRKAAESQSSTTINPNVTSIPNP